MNTVIIAELEQNKKRLEYYQQLKGRAQTAAPVQPLKSAASKKSSSQAPQVSPLDKWIEIYSERVQKLERRILKAQKQAQVQAAVGLKTEIHSSKASKSTKLKSALN